MQLQCLEVVRQRNAKDPQTLQEHSHSSPEIASFWPATHQYEIFRDCHALSYGDFGMSQHVLFARSRAGDGRRTHRSRKNVSGYDNNDLGGKIELLQGKTAHVSTINWRELFYSLTKGLDIFLLYIVHK